jgi:small conductance mechanosensitive channel
MTLLDGVAAAAPEAQQAMDWSMWKFSAWGPWLSVRLLHMALYFLGALILNRIWKLILKRVKKAAEDDDPTTQNELERRVETVTAILRRLGSVVLYGTAFLMTIRDFGVEIGPLLAGLGIAGVAVGFGAQYLVRDVISGFFIVLEDQFRVGDVVKIGDFSGLVEHMYLRTTQIRSVSGDIHIIPNGTIQTVTNMTRQWSRVVLDVGVGYGANLDEVFDALREVAAWAQAEPSMAGKIREPFEVVGVTSLGDSSVMVRMWAKVEPLEQWAIERALRKRVKEVFDARGIEIPFPQRTLSLDARALEALRDLGGAKP